MATPITISAFSDSGWVKVYINGDKVLHGSGTTTIELDNGIHFLTYFVQGLPGDNYSVAIVDPPAELWAVKGNLKLNHTTGQHGITI
ncbi:hypothetical protein [Xanthocytophaga agilis]|uniref:PEGA domain-containing protein n=1 Tax=Xanthocytophaga agilis TaxID=3048010 RepID=A0AAE3R8W4_9BACT|nr:hypothetical protein [Xanthocytophaga agilis]MDJ1505400.1 hypothetical protein [Xanthocytophaga agilis]